jgi:heptosyltransferase-2
MNRDLAQVKTLAVRCPNWVGDIVMATPVFECLRRNLPNARILGLLKGPAQKILRDSPWFDGFIDGNDKSWAGFTKMRSQLREARPDAAILLSNSVRSALTLRLAGVRTLYGYRREWRTALLAGGPAVRRDGGRIVPIPMIDYYLEICRWLGLEVPDDAKPRLFYSDSVGRQALAILAKHGVGETDFVVGLNPGASFGSSKCWPPEYFAELAELCERNLAARVVLLSGPGEEAIVQAILDRTRANAIDLRSEKIDLERLKPVVDRCNLMITNDTGPRHYAVAFDVPVVVVMGPTDPRYTEANTDRTVVVRRELACSPCHLKVCPRQHECMREIKPAEVFSAAETLLSVCAQHGT